MPCYHPLRGYKSHALNPSGKRSIVFSVRDGYRDLPVDLPCGQCIGCRLERSRQWAIRCVHEASLYEENAFVTLTYADKFLPADGGLVVSDFQKFMKRLRFEYSDRKIRFFHCGEYGERSGRPHYHACLFNFDFPDKWHYKTVNGEKYYRSSILERLWPMGNSMLGDVTFESAAYVARYITKKVTGDRAEDHYSIVDRETGEVLSRRPEYVTMSRRPGIGKSWYEKFKSDVYPSDFVVLRGVKMKPPKFYDGQLEKEDPAAFAAIKAERELAGEERADNNTWERLEVRELVQLERFSRLKRSYESED